MIVTSNSLFFRIDTTPALDNIGWQIKVCDPAVSTTVPIAVIPDIVDLTINIALSATGEGSVTFDLDAPFWSSYLDNGRHALTLRESEYLWQAFEDGNLRFEWISQRVEERLIEDSGARTVIFSGPGTAQTLEWAKIFRPGYPAPTPPVSVDVDLETDTETGSSSDTNDRVAERWRFENTVPAMAIWYEMLRAAKSRGTLTFVTPTFDKTNDSAGAPWETVPVSDETVLGYQPQLGVDLLTYLNACTNQETSEQFAMPAEWIMWPGFLLDVRKTIGVHRENQVVFFEGGMFSKQRIRDRSELRNYIAVRDRYGHISPATDEASINRWGRREYLDMEHQHVDDDARRNALSAILLEQYHEEKSQWTVQVPYDFDGRRPFYDYHIGDWIGVSSYTPGLPSTVEAFRVLDITINVDSVGQVNVELTLQSRLEAQQKKLERDITRIIRQVVDAPGGDPGGSPGDPDFVDIEDHDPWAIGDDYTFADTAGIQVFIQSTDPGDKANPGDFWYDISYEGDPVLPTDYEEVIVEEPVVDLTTRERVPGTNQYFE